MLKLTANENKNKLGCKCSNWTIVSNQTQVKLQLRSWLNNKTKIHTLNKKNRVAYRIYNVLQSSYSHIVIKYLYYNSIGFIRTLLLKKIEKVWLVHKKVIPLHSQKRNEHP